jgi:hypothetical protein
MAARMMRKERRVGRLRRLSVVGLLGSVALVVAACGATGDPIASLPVVSAAPAKAVTPAVLLTRVELVRVLGQKQLTLTDTQAAFRPAEAPLLAAAPRVVYQVVLPKDPQKGFIVVYDFFDPTRAASAAAEEAAYLATGPARVQTPPGTVTIIRQVGSTVVVYPWLPEGAQDDAAPGIQAALETLGIGFPVPN